MPSNPADVDGKTAMHPYQRSRFHTLLNRSVLGLLLLAPIGAPAVETATIAPLSPAQLARPAVKVAAVQITGNWIWFGKRPAGDPPGQGGSPDPADAVVKYVERAAADKVDIIAFPELYLGYFKVPSPATEKVAAAARKHRMYVMVGCFELTDDKGSYGNSTLLFDREGKIAGRYFKSHPAIGEGPYLWPPLPDDPEWMMTPGHEYPVFDTDFGRIGILTCYDGYFPEPWRILGLKGAEILFWMNARGGAVEDYIVKTASLQNVVHVVTTNKAVGSGTMICQWPQNIVRNCTEAKEEYISAELPLMLMRNARKHDRLFHQRRPEIYGEITKAYPMWEMYKDLPALPGAPPDFVKIEGLAEQKPAKPAGRLRPGEQVSQLSIRASQTWMNGSVELRFPEVLRSSLGAIYIDHHSPENPIKDHFLAYPKWTRDEDTLEWSWSAKTKNGFEVTARALPRRDGARLSVEVTNRGDKTAGWMEMNPCLMLTGSPDFAGARRPQRIYAFMDGKLRPLSETAPKPDPPDNNTPWILIATKSGLAKGTLPKESPTWYRVEQTAEKPFMAAVSHDGKHVIAIGWDSEPEALMSNGGYPCMHAGPGPRFAIEPGRTVRWQGRLYLMEGTPEEALAKYEEDARNWQKRPKP